MTLGFKEEETGENKGAEKKIQKTKKACVERKDESGAGDRGRKPRK